MILRTIIFLLLNFGALAIGGFFTGKGVPSEWYLGLNKAPWTPAGWVFGFAWTSIMIFFSVYMAFLWPTRESKGLLVALYLIQWVLNVGWNPSFFYFHRVDVGLVVISLLTVLMGLFLLAFWKELSFKSLLVLPYVLWLLIATSLNAYAFLKN